MKKLTILTTLLIAIVAIADGQTINPDTAYKWLANNKSLRYTDTTIKWSGTSAGVNRIFAISTAPLTSNSILFSGKSGKLLSVDMVSKGQKVSIYNSGYDSLIVTFSKKRMVWKNDSTLILINK